MSKVATIRFRVTAVATAVVVIVLIAVGFALVVNQRRTLTESLDESMASRVDELVPVIASGDLPTLTHLGDDDSVAQVVSSDGEVLAASPFIDGRPPIGEPISTGQTIGGGDVPGIEDGDVRLLTRVVDSPDGDVVVYFAASTDDIDESVTTLVTALSIAVPVVAVVLGTLIWFLVGRTLRPVERIRSEVASIGGADVHRRVPVPAADDEIGRLARTMNDMLERVDDASRRQRRFVADASHELRSPLTRMRSELEVDLAHPDGADPAATHESVLEEVVGLQRLVDDLLLLARNAAVDPRAAGRDELVDLTAVVDRVVRTARGRDDVKIDVGGGDGLVRGNAAELARAIGNLLDNALRHSTSEVRITVRGDGPNAIVSVEDDGPGIPVGERERIFERFARVDEGRAAEHGGTGLGLAIARDIVERHGGTLTVDARYVGGARFVVAMPAASPADEPAG